MPTLRQERLAEALENPEIRTKKDALLAAGYSETSALKNTGRQTALEGTQRAREALVKRRRDSARSWRSDGEKLLQKAVEKADTLHPIEQVQAGVALVKLSMEAGEVPDAASSLDRWKRYKEKLYRRAWRNGFRAALEGRDPLHMVLSPSVTDGQLEKVNNDNEHE